MKCIILHRRSVTGRRRIRLDDIRQQRRQTRYTWRARFEPDSGRRTAQ